MTVEEDVAEFTGERYLPNLGGVIRAEHLHRYALAAALIDGGCDVLDIACGEGYGAALLARRAERVYGVDIDPETIERARCTYADESHVEFRVGSCDLIPLLDSSVDTVVSFETIEHHDRHEKMLREIKRVLRPGGVLILSSPNKRVYTDAADYHNPFHVRELYRNELEDLLREHFTGVRLYGQRAGIGSLVYSVEPGKSGEETALALIEETPGRITTQTDDRAAVYYLAVCSDNAARLARAERFSASSFFAMEDAFLGEMEKGLLWNQGERERLQALATQLEAWVHERDARLEQADRDLRAAQDEARHFANERDRLQAELADARDQLDRIYRHPAYRTAVQVKRTLNTLSGRGKGTT